MYIYMGQDMTKVLYTIKTPIKQDLLQILVLVQQQNFLNC